MQIVITHVFSFKLISSSKKYPRPLHMLTAAHALVGPECYRREAEVLPTLLLKHHWKILVKARASLTFFPINKMFAQSIAKIFFLSAVVYTWAQKMQRYRAERWVGCLYCSSVHTPPGSFVLCWATLTWTAQVWSVDRSKDVPNKQKWEGVGVGAERAPAGWASCAMPPNLWASRQPLDLFVCQNICRQSRLRGCSFRAS